jgi:Ca2+-binding EF-hand superfamily protein
MFKPKTDRIRMLAARYPRRIQELERTFDRRTNVYIDFANVRPWATKLGWHVDVKRLKQFLDSFDTINSIKLYQ